jgi:hypothetical protein
VCQTLSGAYFVAIAQSLFANRMLHAIQTSTSSLDVVLVLRIGASKLQEVFGGSDLTAVIEAYMVGLKDVFAFSLSCASLSVLLTLLIPLKRLPDHGKKPAEKTESIELVEEKNGAPAQA